MPRIVAVADTYRRHDHLRPYRRAMPAEVAAGEIARGAGSQFCPHVVAAFERLFARGAFTVEAGAALLRSLSQDDGKG